MRWIMEKSEMMSFGFFPPFKSLLGQGMDSGYCTIQPHSLYTSIQKNFFDNLSIICTGTVYPIQISCPEPTKNMRTH